MSQTKDALALLSEPLTKYDVDLKNPSYREAHKALVKAVERNLTEETVRQSNKLSTQIRLALVGVLALAVTITACFYMWSQVAIETNARHTEVEIRKIEAEK